MRQIWTTVLVQTLARQTKEFYLAACKDICMTNCVMFSESILTIICKRSVRFEDITAGNMKRNNVLECDIVQYGRSSCRFIETFSVYSLLTGPTIRPWKLKQYSRAKYWSTCNRLQGILSQKITFYMSIVILLNTRIYLIILKNEKLLRVRRELHNEEIHNTFSSLNISTDTWEMRKLEFYDR